MLYSEKKKSASPKLWQLADFSSSLSQHMKSGGPVNFYISSSSRAKLFIAVLTFVLLTVALDGALELYAARKTSKDRWIENKIYKSAHLSKRDPGETDYIFIGSSRTIFHISTAVFADYDQRIYNFGVSGMTLYDFPYFAQKAAAQKPKTIVLNISVNDLFSDNSEKKDLFDETTATATQHKNYQEERLPTLS